SSVVSTHLANQSILTSFILYILCAYILFFFFFYDPATTDIYTLSLHDALPISFTAAAPEWSDLLYADTRAAWTREISAPIRSTERVEAAAYRGKPVYFRVLYPWADPWRDRAHQPSSHQKLANIVGIVVYAALLVGRDRKS